MACVVSTLNLELSSQPLSYKFQTKQTHGFFIRAELALTWASPSLLALISVSSFFLCRHNSNTYEIAITSPNHDVQYIITYT